MPVGPQHRSGGSFRSGRSSSGGFRSSSRSFGSSSFGRRPNVIIIGGGTHNRQVVPEENVTDPIIVEAVKKKTKASLWLTLIIPLFILIVATIVVSVEKKEFKEKLSIMDSDAEYYEQLINNPKEIITADCYKFYYMTYEGVDYYYVSYHKFHNGGIIKGETYAQFTSADIRALGGKIQIAIDDNNYSMNTSWVKENAEYLYTRDNAQSYSTTSTILIVATCVVGALFIFAIVNMIKVTKNEDKKIFDRLSELKKSKDIKEDNAANGIKCAYCGNRIKDGEKKCPGCGASIK